MELKSLFLHSASLIRIILKSSKPADSIAREYFNSNRYIGSNDRKFISESVWTSLRNHNFSIFCLNQADFPIEINDINNNNHAQQLKNELFFIFISCIISNSYQNLTFFFNPEEILRKFYKKNDYNFESASALALSELFQTSTEQITFLIKQIKSFHSELLRKASITADKQLSEENFKIMESLFSVNKWIMKSWSESGMTKNEIFLLAQSLTYPAPIGLRLASSLVKREVAIEFLKESGIDAKAGLFSPASIILSKRQPVNNHELFKKGLLDVQDEGSQLISFACSPEETDIVLDACAGAGGKTLHLASLQNDKGSILATDIEFNRLKEIKFRASRFGFKSINTLLLKNKEIPREFYGKFDLVLVDAPCSGMGTSRRLPLPKIRLTPELVSKLANNQFGILSRYASCVKSGGILVYSTCSLMPEENQQVVIKFLKNNPEFEPDFLEPVFNKYSINLPGLKQDDFFTTLYPSVHGCDGFFIARMKKIL